MVISRRVMNCIAPAWERDFEATLPSGWLVQSPAAAFRVSASGMTTPMSVVPAQLGDNSGGRGERVRTSCNLFKRFFMDLRKGLRFSRESCVQCDSAAEQLLRPRARIPAESGGMAGFCLEGLK